MNILRFTIPFFAFFGALLLYWLLYQTIIVNSSKKLDNSSLGNINFTRVIQDREVDKKQRIKKELPKPKPVKTPPKVSVNAPKQDIKIQKQSLDLDIPLVKLPVNIQQNNFLKGSSFKQKPAQSSEAVPMLRIPPVYPRRAKMLKKEGYVKLKLFISTAGTVKKARILESKPKKFFDKAALRSVYGWKFKPRYVDGKAVEQTVTQVLEFKLRN